MAKWLNDNAAAAAAAAAADGDGGDDVWKECNHSTYCTNLSTNKMRWSQMLGRAGIALYHI